MGCTRLTITGGLLEIIGFLAVGYDLYRLKEREFGTPPSVRWMRATVRKLLRRKPRMVEVGADLGAKYAIRARATQRTPPGDTIEERIAALEQNFKYLEDETDAEHKFLETGIDTLRQELRRTRAELEEQREEREKERKEFVRGSMRWQVSGTLLFIAGTIFSILGNTLTC